ncbi:hypothetical protein V8F20_008175 [Naviculisporaceae sp. PSN 640]
MCTVHQRIHACGHTSTHWRYCPSSRFDLNTGKTEACEGLIIDDNENSAQKCPLTNCLFRHIPTGGWWKCCQCGRDPNTGTSCVYDREEPQRITNPATGESFLDYTCQHMMCRYCTLFDKDGKIQGIKTGKRKDSGNDGGKSNGKDKDSSKKQGSISFLLSST